VEASGYVSIEVDGRDARVPKGIPLKAALEHCGVDFSPYPREESLKAPCGVGGCMSCVVRVNGEILPSCVTAVRGGMRVSTEVPTHGMTRRGVHGFQGHSVGGVGTPWELKGRRGSIEVACFAAGCNFRCPQCQNWTTAYLGKGEFLGPDEVAERMTRARELYGVKRMAISGGECTLNRGWLVDFIRHLKRRNPDAEARFHVDTNGSILVEDYIDELVEAGMTDVGIDLKGFRPATFLSITGLREEGVAKRYLETAWNDCRHLVNHYRGRVFLGIGIPYSKDLISLEEVHRIGTEIAFMDPEVQVCLLDYRPEFRRRHIDGFRIRQPDCRAMAEAADVLREAGLKKVIAQTAFGHVGP
jgi:pyruvate formate lyase activating enzyme